MAAINIMQAFKEKPAPLDFVLPGLLAGTVGAIVSPGGAGKSMLALELAAFITSGYDISGFGNGEIFPNGQVAFLAAEDPPSAIEHRMHALGQHITQSITDETERELTLELIAMGLEIQSLLGCQIDIERPDWAQFVESMAANRRLLFIDTLRRFHVSDENDSGAMAIVLSILEGIAKRTGCAIVFLHHASKAAALNGQGDLQQASRGSSVLVDNVRWQMFVAGMSENEARTKNVDAEMRRFHVRCGVSKQNYGAPTPDTWLKRIDGGVLVLGEFPTSYVTSKKTATAKKGGRREEA